MKNGTFLHEGENPSLGLTESLTSVIVGEMNPLISLLEQRVNAARERMESAKAELADYERALARERGKEPRENANPSTKGEKLEAFLKSMALVGTTYKEINQFLKESNMEVGGNFAYNTIARLKDQTPPKVEERNGKLFYRG
jgi:hypothetical protein